MEEIIGDLKLTSMSPSLLLVKFCLYVCFQRGYSIFASSFKGRKNFLEKRVGKE